MSELWRLLIFRSEYRSWTAATPKSLGGARFRLKIELSASQLEDAAVSQRQGFDLPCIRRDTVFLGTIVLENDGKPPGYRSKLWRRFSGA